MRTSPVKTVLSNGIADGEFGLYYWSERLYSEKGEKVYIKRDNEQYHKCLVFKAENDEYLGEAVLEGFDIQGINISKADKATLKRIKAMINKDNKYKRYEFKQVIFSLLKVLNHKAKNEIEFVLTDSQIQALLKEEKVINKRQNAFFQRNAEAIKKVEFKNELERMQHKVKTHIYYWESEKEIDLERL